MIKTISSPVEREQVFARARHFAGDDEHRLSTEWLSRPDIFCVAEENDNHGVHYEEESLRNALKCFQEDNWRAVEVINHDRLSDPLEIGSPAFQTVFTSSGIDLASHFNGRGFMLFSMENEATILYSPEYEYRLIAGTEEFVRTYIKSLSEDPMQGLQPFFEENASSWHDSGSTSYAKALERSLGTAMSQVRLPQSSLIKGTDPCWMLGPRNSRSS